MKITIPVDIELHTVESFNGGVLRMGNDTLLTWRNREVVGDRYEVLEASDGNLYAGLEDLKHAAEQRIAHSVAANKIKDVFNG